MTSDHLTYAARELAHLYSAQRTDIARLFVFTRFNDGMDIPASTQVEVIIRLVHKPDMQVTPILEMEEAIA